jgi:hypothetical protein
MRVYIFLAIIISAAYAQPIINGTQKIDSTVKKFKATLYFFAPDSWINAFNAVPEEGQRCLMEAAKTNEGMTVYQSLDFDAMKKDIQAKCPGYVNELNKFVDSMSETVKSLPAAYYESVKEASFLIFYQFIAFLVWRSNGRNWPKIQRNRFQQIATIRKRIQAIHDRIC